MHEKRFAASLAFQIGFVYDWVRGRWIVFVRLARLNPDEINEFLFRIRDRKGRKDSNERC